MRAAFVKEYGAAASALVYSKTVAKPKITTTDGVLVRVRSAVLSSLDIEVRRGEWTYLMDQTTSAHNAAAPHITGYEFAGIVEEVGSSVSSVSVGDEVCGLCSLTSRNGACAEYTVQSEHALVVKPKLVLHDDAAMAIGPGIFGLTALHYNLKVERGTSILICDAASPEGYVLIQLAAELGLRIFATARSQAQVSFLEVLGDTVARIIDEVQENLADVIMEETNRMGVDYIVETLRYTPTLPSSTAESTTVPKNPVRDTVPETGEPPPSINNTSKPKNPSTGTGNPFTASAPPAPSSAPPASAGVLSTEDDEIVLLRLRRKRLLIQSLATHGRWATLSNDMQLDPDEARIMGLKNASLSWIFPQAWVVCPSKQGHFLHIMDSVMKHLSEGKFRPLPCTTFDLAQIRDAHRQLENTLQYVGRVVIKM